MKVEQKRAYPPPLCKALYQTSSLLTAGLSFREYDTVLGLFEASAVQSKIAPFFFYFTPSPQTVQVFSYPCHPAVEPCVCNRFDIKSDHIEPLNDLSAAELPQGSGWELGSTVCKSKDSDEGVAVVIAIVRSQRSPPESK
eukprot:scaffold8196_cov100-Cylindrotheca_fusiformis.AAC.2